MRHEKYGSIVTPQEAILLDILHELKDINSKLTPAPAPEPPKKKLTRKGDLDG